MIDTELTLIDNGLFTELAIRLARELKKVRSYVTWRDEFPTINDRCLGAGLDGEGVEWVEDPYVAEVFNPTQIYCYPDIFFAGDKQLVQRAGKLAWGSDTGDDLETKRVWFRGLQEKLGLPVPKYVVVQGWRALSDHLLENDRHCFIKATSKIRGSMETHEFFDFEQDEYWLWDLRIKLGCGAESILFLIEDPVESPYETGLDTYCINGKVPKTPMQGIEIKGKLLLASAQTKSQTPTFMDDALATLQPEMANRNYCNFVSCEFRKNILTDFCARAPNPGLGVEMEMIKNLGQIIVAGAQGECLEPEFEAEYGIQAAIFHDHEGEKWKQFRLPEEVRRWVKLMEFCKVGDLYQIIPRVPYGTKIGWLIGIGDTVQAAANHLQRNKAMLEDHPFEIDLSSVETAIEQAKAMEQEGHEFGDDSLPEPETVLNGDS